MWMWFFIMYSNVQQRLACSFFGTLCFCWSQEFQKCVGYLSEICQKNRLELEREREPVLSPSGLTLSMVNSRLFNGEARGGWVLPLRLPREGRGSGLRRRGGRLRRRRRRAHRRSGRARRRRRPLLSLVEPPSV